MIIKKAPRPRIIPGIIIKVPTSCGNMYVQMGFLNDKLFEIFATLGRAGGCAMAYGEGLTRSITLGLRCRVPVAEYIDQLRTIRCPSPMPFPKEDAVMSCPDAIATTLIRYGTLSSKDLVKIVEDSVEGGAIVEEGEGAALAEIERLAEERRRQEL